MYKKFLISTVCIILIFYIAFKVSYKEEQAGLPITWNDAKLEKIKAETTQAGLEITWADTDETNFVIDSNSKITDKRYVAKCMNGMEWYSIVINTETGKVIPTKSYNGIIDFSEGRAAVYYCDIMYYENGYSPSNYRYGFIDKDGKEVIPTVYERAYYFSEGLADVQKGQDYGYIDYNGNVVFPFEYTFAQPFDGGYAAVGKIDENGEKIAGIIDKKGNFTKVEGARTISKFENGIARVFSDNEEFFIDVHGNKVENETKKPEVLNQYGHSRDFLEGRSIVANLTYPEWQTKYGVIDEAGNVIIPFNYSYIYDYKDGMSSAQLALGNLAYFDIDGDKVTPFKYSVTQDFNEGAAIVGTGNYKDKSLLEGAINKYGNEIVPIIFNRISDFNNGYALVGVGYGDNPYVSTSQKLGILKIPKTVNINDESKKYITITLNGEEIIFDQDPLMDSNRVMVPIRAIFEKIGAELIWEDGKVTATKGEIKIELTIGEKETFINGESYMLDVPAQLVSGRTLVPVRFISECFDYYVDWNQETKKVIITKWLLYIAKVWIRENDLSKTTSRYWDKNKYIRISSIHR